VSFRGGKFWRWIVFREPRRGLRVYLLHLDLLIQLASILYLLHHRFTSYRDFTHFLLSYRLSLPSFCNHIVRILRVRPYFNYFPACCVSHPKGVDRRRVIVTDLLLLGVESDTLTDMGITMRAPYVKWHLEAHGKLTTLDSWRRLAVDFVACHQSFLVRRDIAAHVEAMSISSVYELLKKYWIIPLHVDGIVRRLVAGSRGLLS
jgi:hypothetical protein